MFKSTLVVTGILLFSILTLKSQDGSSIEKHLYWTDVKAVSIADGYTLYKIEFSGATFLEEFADLPIYKGKVRAESAYAIPEITITNAVFEPLGQEISRVRGIDKVSDKIEVRAHISMDRKQPYALYTFLPIRKNPMTGQYEKLVSFVPEVIFKEAETREQQSLRRYQDQSVMATGKWYKIGVRETGLYMITYTELQQMGFDPSAIDPRNIRIYGNGGGMLPEKLQEPRYDDLVENAVFVSGEGDGKFDQGDYILFYGESPKKV
jgi:hypothetical protein